MKRLPKYNCRERFFEIIPEMPTLSQCDYLLTRHPELRERANDDFAGMYGPSVINISISQGCGIKITHSVSGFTMPYTPLCMKRCLYER